MYIYSSFTIGSLGFSYLIKGTSTGFGGNVTLAIVGFVFVRLLTLVGFVGLTG
jgi:hypothetical protein